MFIYLSRKMHIELDIITRFTDWFGSHFLFGIQVVSKYVLYLKQMRFSIGHIITVCSDEEKLRNGRWSKRLRNIWGIDGRTDAEL